MEAHGACPRRRASLNFRQASVWARKPFKTKGFMARVVLAMSGGVDSSVAAHLLQQQGHDVIGVFMRHGEHSPAATCPVASESPAALLPLADVRADGKQGCCSAADAHDARRVADRLDIPFYALDLQEEFARIINYFVAEYTIGRTPNPCVMCNTWLKFGRLFQYADSVGADFVATGHYARLVRSPAGDTQLLRGVDVAKDQSYALFGVQRQRMRRMLLPVGEYEKSQIRELAGGLGLRVADKPDSQEICFVTTCVGTAMPASTHPASSSRSTAVWSAVTQASSVSRSASARAWEWPWANEPLWSVSSPTPTAWSWEHTRTWRGER